MIEQIKAAGRIGIIGLVLNGCSSTPDIASNLDLKCETNPNQIAAEIFEVRNGQKISIGSNTLTVKDIGLMDISVSNSQVQLRGRDLLLSVARGLDPARWYAVLVDPVEGGNTRITVSLDCTNPSGEKSAG